MKRNISVVPKLMMSNPRLAIQMGLGFLGSEGGKRREYRRTDGVSNELSLMTFRLTSLCNLRCLMCGQRGKTGTLKGEKAVEESKTLVSMERYMELTDEVSHKVKIFYMWGGEPFLYPGFMDLAQYMAARIPIFTVNTNGLLLAENAERIVRDKWTGFFISLDGFRETNDAIRGEGSYQRVIDGIKAITDIKKRTGSSLPHMGIVTTVSNMNYMYLDQLVEATRNIGLSWHIINLGTYMNEKVGAEQNKVMQDKFGITPGYWQGFANGCNEGIDGTRFQEILSRVHKIKCDHPVITVPVIDPSLIGLYYSDLEVLVQDRCSAPWFSANVHYNGEVYFCADYPDYSIGNIKDSPMLELYNNERAREFRLGLKNSPHGIFPACRRCYQLMLCGQRIRHPVYFDGTRPDMKK